MSLHRPNRGIDDVWTSFSPQIRSRFHSSSLGHIISSHGLGVLTEYPLGLQLKEDLMRLPLTLRSTDLFLSTTYEVISELFLLNGTFAYPVGQGCI